MRELQVKMLWIDFRDLQVVVSDNDMRCLILPQFDAPGGPTDRPVNVKNRHRGNNQRNRTNHAQQKHQQ
jgi:hypothetical protein